MREGDGNAGIRSRLRIKEGRNRNGVRGEQSMATLIAERSDTHPGQYVCLECRTPLNNLMEAWRRNNPMESCSMAALFCVECAQRLNRVGADLSPLRLSQLDRLNLGLPIG